MKTDEEMLQEAMIFGKSERMVYASDIILSKAIIELAATVKRETMHGREALSATTIQALWSLIPPPPKPTPQELVKAQKIDVAG